MRSPLLFLKQFVYSSEFVLALDGPQLIAGGGGGYIEGICLSAFFHMILSELSSLKGHPCGSTIDKLFSFRMLLTL